MGKWKTPADLKYQDTDEWIRLEGDEGIVGITDYAQDQLNDIVFLELPAVGDSFAQGDSFGVVEVSQGGLGPAFAGQRNGHGGQQRRRG